MYKLVNGKKVEIGKKENYIDKKKSFNWLYLLLLIIPIIVGIFYYIKTRKNN